MDLREKVAYLRGLAEGLDLKTGSKKDRVLVEVLEILSLFADRIENVSDECEELSSYIDSLDEDLAEMEEQVYGNDIDDYDDMDDFDAEECMNCLNCDESESPKLFKDDAVEGKSEDND